MSLAPNTKKYEYAVRETTLWEDILVDKNILLPDEKLVAHKEAVEKARLRGEKEEDSREEKVRKARNDSDELERLEDEFVDDDDDERMLAKFRAARLEELKRDARKQTFDSVETLARDEFIAKVKEASTNGGENGKPMFVVVELFKEGLERSTRTTKVVDELARRHPTVRFVRMISDQCIQGWPDSRVPCIIIYHDGEMTEQLIGLEECGNGNTDLLELILSRYGVVPKPEKADRITRQGKTDRDDDDW